MGAALGAVNGLFTGMLRLPSIIVTLAMMVTLREGLRWTTQGAWVQNLPANFQWLGFGQNAGQWLIVVLAVSVSASFAWALRKLGAGRAIYATGSDAEAARLAGIEPRRVVFGVFVLMGALSGLAALLNAVRLGTLIGVALLGTIGTALTFLGINPFWEKAIQGAIILAALASDTAFGQLERFQIADFRLPIERGK